jgi:hypothetical protein
MLAPAVCFDLKEDAQNGPIPFFAERYENPTIPRKLSLVPETRISLALGCPRIKSPEPSEGYGCGRFGAAIQRVRCWAADHCLSLRTRLVEQLLPQAAADLCGAPYFPANTSLAAAWAIN